MSSEARTIRPFTGLEQFEAALKKSYLHFGPDVCRPDESIRSDLLSHQFNLRPVDLQWAKDEAKFKDFKDELQQGAAEAGVDSSSVSLVVVAETSYLKEAKILLNHPLSGLSSLDRTVNLASTDDRPAPFRAWRHGFSVDVYALLNRSVAPSPLRPHRKGTWFARERFEVKTTHSSERLFRPIPLDEERRGQLNLPSETARYVVLGEHNPLQEYDEQAEEPEFYIDEDLLSELSVSSSAASSQAIQLELALHFISHVIREASRRLSKQSVPFEEISDSLVARILQLCAGSANNEERMRKLYNQISNRPQHVVACAEDRLGIRDALVKNVKENS